MTSSGIGGTSRPTRSSTNASNHLWSRRMRMIVRAALPSLPHEINPTYLPSFHPLFAWSFAYFGAVLMVVDGGGELVPSSRLCVGDLVVLHADDRVPADMILMKTRDKTGTVFIRTDQLDGETDWKLRHAVPSVQKNLPFQSLPHLLGSYLANNRNSYPTNHSFHDDDSISILPILFGRIFFQIFLRNQIVFYDDPMMIR